MLAKREKQTKGIVRVEENVNDAPFQAAASRLPVAASKHVSSMTVRDQVTRVLCAEVGRLDEHLAEKWAYQLAPFIR
jgi:hypothetical protein